MSEEYNVKSISKRASYRHGDVRESAIKDAIRQVEELGYEKFSLRKVGDSLGVSHKAIYRYFPAKSDLLSHVAAYGFNQLADKLNETDRAKTLNSIFEVYIDFAFERQRLYALMFGQNFLDVDDHRHIEIAVKRVTTAATSVMLEEKPKDCKWDSQSVRNAIVSLWSCAHGLVALDQAKLLQSAGSALSIKRIKESVRQSIRAQLLLMDKAE